MKVLVSLPPGSIAPTLEGEAESCSCRGLSWILCSQPDWLNRDTLTTSYLPSWMESSLGSQCRSFLRPQVQAETVLPMVLTLSLFLSFRNLDHLVSQVIPPLPLAPWAARTILISPSPCSLSYEMNLIHGTQTLWMGSLRVTLSAGLVFPLHPALGKASPWAGFAASAEWVQVHLDHLLSIVLAS